MGQLEVFSLDDNTMPMIISGMFNGYFTEEIEATIESLVMYTYTANITSISKVSRKKKSAGQTNTIIGKSDEGQTAIPSSLPIDTSVTREINKEISERVFWSKETLVNKTHDRDDFSEDEFAMLDKLEEKVTLEDPIKEITNDKNKPTDNKELPDNKDKNPPEESDSASESIADNEDSSSTKS